MSAVHSIVAIHDGTSLKPTRARIALSDTWAPYARIELTIPMPDVELLDALDPRNVPVPRVECTVTRSTPAQSRVFDLAVREREVDHQAATVTLTLASDEWMLIDKARVSGSSESGIVDGDLTPADLRMAINHVVFAHLVEGNLARNPAPNATWTAAGTLDRAVVDSASSGRYLEGTRNSTAAAAIYPSSALPDTLEPGQQYTYQVSVWTTVTIPLAVRVHDGDGGAVILTGASTSVTGGTWTDMAITFTAPASGVAYPSVYSATAGVGRRLLVRQLTLTAGPDPLPWAAPQLEDDDLLTADLSATPTALLWKPAMRGWDFLEPLLQRAGLRLFCDEARGWHLVDAQHTVAGQVNITRGRNVTKARDRISRAADWYDSVIVRYRDAGAETFDIAGAPGTKTLELTYDTAYPGAGAAARILKRAQGRGRVLDLAALSDYSVSPGKAVRADLPLTPIQVGYVTEVAWELPRDEMTLRSRGLTDTPATAWAFLPAGEAWSDSPIGESWIDETV